MSRQRRTSWWQQSWLLAVLLAVGSVLVVLEIWAQAWLALVSTVAATIAIVVAWAFSDANDTRARRRVSGN